MKFRIGLVLGFGIGYYLGARAGRARYEQMHRRLERLRDSRLFERMQAAVELGVERMRHWRSNRLLAHGRLTWLRTFVAPENT